MGLFCFSFIFFSHFLARLEKKRMIKWVIVFRQDKELEEGWNNY